MDQFNQFIQTLNQWIAKIPSITPVLINLVLGALLIIFGYKIFRLWLLVFGAQFGLYLGTLLCDRLGITQGSAFVVKLLCILATAIFYWVALRVSFAVSGFSLGFIAAGHYAGFIVENPNIWIRLGIALVCGILAYLFARFFLVLGSSYYGALIFTDSLYALMATQLSGRFIGNRQLPPGYLPYILIGVTILLTVLGTLHQYRASGRTSKIKALYV